MGVGLVRSLQPPDILWIHWRVYNSITNTSKGVFFGPLLMPMLEAFSLLYTLIKLYYTKALSRLVSGPGLNVSPPEAKNPESRLARDPQDKVRILGALVLCSPSDHVFRCTLLTLWFACVNE